MMQYNLYLNQQQKYFHEQNDTSYLLHMRNNNEIEFHSWWDENSVIWKQ